MHEKTEGIKHGVSIKVWVQMISKIPDNCQKQHADIILIIRYTRLTLRRTSGALEQ